MACSPREALLPDLHNFPKQLYQLESQWGSHKFLASPGYKMRSCVKQNKRAAVYTILFLKIRKVHAIGSTATGVGLELPLYAVLGCPAAGPRPGLLLGGGEVSARADPTDSLTW